MRGFLKVKDGKIVDASGRAVFLRGVNLGGWLMMEGYILGGRNIAEHTFKNEFRLLNGNKELLNFEKSFRGNFITEKDIKNIKQMGANCLRIPFNYRIVNSKDIIYLDRVIAWCRKNKIRCILDMHAAPGAQNPDWHADSDGEMLLWKNKSHQRQFFKLWQFLARRYRDEEIIAGYDVVNEPTVFKATKKVLIGFYKQAVKAIQKFDKNHIIFLEANLWGQKLDFFGKPFAPNIAYSIHVYQPIDFTFNFVRHLSYPGNIGGQYWDKRKLKARISGYYRLAKRWRVPIYVGEFGIHFRGAKEYGELSWLKDALEIFKQFGFHWTYWTYKAIAGAIYPDGIFQYLDNPCWVQRQGPVIGWENFCNLWKKQKKRIVQSWRTKNFVQNKYISAWLRRYF